MDFLKALFNDGPLTFDQFVEAAKAAKINLVDLSKGGYVSEAKHNDKLGALQQQVTDLTDQIGKRDADIATLRTSLEAAQADAGKLAGVQQTLTTLQTQYAEDKTRYEKRISDQQYEFAIRERANELQFSSASAKKAFIQDAIGKGFKMDGDKLLGYDEFAEQYKANDPGAFVAPDPNPAPPVPSVTLPGGHDNPPGRKITLSEMMRYKNDHPDAEVRFDN